MSLGSENPEEWEESIIESLPEEWQDKINNDEIGLDDVPKDILEKAREGALDIFGNTEYSFE